MRGWDGLVLSNGATTLAVPLLVGLGTSSADSGNHVRRNTASVTNSGQRGVAQLASSWVRSTRNIKQNVDQECGVELHRTSV